MLCVRLSFETAIVFDEMICDEMLTEEIYNYYINKCMQYLMTCIYIVLNIFIFNLKWIIISLILWFSFSCNSKLSCNSIISYSDLCDIITYVCTH